jgi:putative endonuclease
VPSGRQALGSYGESLAARWCVAQGYEVLARNWRTREAELDLVLRKGNEIVFCEVKTRVDDRFGTPAEAVTAAKQRRVRSAAVAFLHSQAHERRGGSMRFDVACVVGQSVEVIESAF